MMLQDLDPRVSYADQLARGGEDPIELINVFTMDTDDVDRFLEVWAEDAEYMKQQRGFIRTQLHRGTAGSATFVNVATWESAGALRDAFRSEAFGRMSARYPDSVVARPHVCSPVAVPGICTA